MQVEIIRPIKACTIIANLRLLARALSFLNTDRQTRTQPRTIFKDRYDSARVRTTDHRVMVSHGITYIHDEDFVDYCT